MAQYRIDSQEYLANGTTIFEAVMLADKDGNIINSVGVSANINIAAGLVDGYSFVHRTGAVPEMANNDDGSVWGVNNTLYPWATFDANGAGQLTVTTSSSSDYGDTVTIYGLDASYNQISETVTLQSGGITTTASFLRIYSAYFHNSSVAGNVGTITIKAHTVTVAVIAVNQGATALTQYTIPAGYTGYITQGTCSIKYGADATGFMKVRNFGETSFFTGHSFEVSGAGGQYMYRFSVPLKVTEKSDIDIFVSVRSNNARVTAAYDLILVANS